MNIKISVKNFGPIEQGEIALDDLNVFIGSNNAGKSYFATLVYSLMQSLRFASGSRMRRLYRVDGGTRLIYPSVRHVTRSLNLTDINVKLILEKLAPIYKSEQEEVSLDQELFEAFQKAALGNLLSEFVTNVKKNMTPKLGNIVRFGERAFEVKISSGNDYIEFISEKNELKVKDSQLTWKDIRFVKVESATKADKRRLIRGENVYLRGNSAMIQLTKTQISRLFTNIKEGNADETKYAIEEMGYFLGEALELTFPDLFSAPRVFYLPAARSGILQAHRIIAANAVQMTPLFGINRIEIGQMSGTVADFLTHILAIDQEERGLLEISKQFEKKLIHGHVDLQGKDQYSLPEIIYEFKKHKIPLNRTSSTVSELAPLFLLLKHVISKEDMVIIEEPEAHLHPANQKLLAELINAMVTNKVQLLITTHSDFLLGQLSMLIKTPVTSSPFIRAAKTNVNLFKYNDLTGSTTVEKVSVTDQEGIDEREFGKVYEELYQEHLKIDIRREAGGVGDKD